MAKIIQDESSHSRSKHIHSSRKQVTILFTDIEGSTEMWDKSGDIEGRLMIDQHNRLLFPVVKHFKGSIIKTIGDAIMASFKKPQNALKAAIAMQQMLEKERLENPNFDMRVRIGIHSGDAVVEKNDVFGDVVNVAARVEAEANGSEILISSDLWEHVKNQGFKLSLKGSFTPKGKRKKLNLHKCKWESHPSLIDNVKTDRFMPVEKTQRYELLACLALALSTNYFIFNQYIRYFLMDSEKLAYFFLSPGQIYEYRPLLLTAIVCAAITIYTAWFIIFKIKRIPIFLLKLVTGVFGASIIFITLYGIAHLLPIEDYLNKGIKGNLNKVIHESEYLLVKVTAEKASIFNIPSTKGKVIKTLKKGMLLLLVDVKKEGNITWNKVPVSNNSYGWVARVIPPQLGVPEKRLTRTTKFYFRNIDFYILSLSIFGFIWGMFKFRIRPV